MTWNDGYECHIQALALFQMTPIRVIPDPSNGRPMADEGG